MLDGILPRYIQFELDPDTSLCCKKNCGNEPRVNSVTETLIASSKTSHKIPCTEDFASTVNIDGKLLSNLRFADDINLMGAIEKCVP